MAVRHPSSVQFIDDVAALVAAGRTSLTAHRRITKQGTGHGSSANALERHAATLRLVQDKLTELDRCDLAGALQAEGDLLDRIDDSAAGNERPELVLRLKGVRWQLTHPANKVSTPAPAATVESGIASSRVVQAGAARLRELTDDELLECQREAAASHDEVYAAAVQVVQDERRTKGQRVTFNQLAVGDTVLVWLGRKGNQPATVTHLVSDTPSGHHLVVTDRGNKCLGAGGTVQRTHAVGQDAVEPQHASGDGTP